MKGLLRLLGIKKREEIVVVKVTKYRTLDDGYFNYLQYEKNGKWERIPKPYYSRWGGTSPYSSDMHVCDLHDDRISDFIENWPDIEDYLTYCSDEIKRKKHKVDLEIEKQEARKGTVKYL